MFEHELDRYWKTVVNSIKDGLMIVDRRGIIVSVNKALENMIQYSRDELIGQSCEVLNCDVCDKARQENGGHWCRLFKTGAINMRKCTIMSKEGKVIPVLKNASLLHDDGGETIGAVETITDLTEVVEKENQIAQFRRVLQAEDGFHGIIGTSAAMQDVFDLITNASQSDAPVIITGESGTGKELVCKAIHAISQRNRKPLVKVNCAALTDSLLESELFGHVRGAFTGAWRDREGRFESAHQGDLFLDEIGDLPLSTQVKLLRVLEEKEIERVGDHTPIPVDVRIITATNKNIEDLIAQGRFREDLYFRVNVFPLTIPPLKDRPEDIPIIIQHFLEQHNQKSAKKVTGLSPEAVARLAAYAWPGNVRELRNAIEYALVLCPGGVIESRHLPQKIAAEAVCPPLFAASPDQERDDLIRVLRQAGGNQSAAARMLGVSRVTVWKRMKKHRIDLTRDVN